MDHMDREYSKTTFGVHCHKIRHKSLYTGEAPNPGVAEGFFDGYDAAAYWCADTLTGFGPDGQPVRPDVCQGGRGCCKL
jgi:hypothetical protein